MFGCLRALGRACCYFLFLSVASWACATEPDHGAEAWDGFRSGAFRGVTLADLGRDGKEVYSEQDYEDLKDIGANLVRIFVYLRRCGQCTSYEFPEAQIAYVERVLARAEQIGFHVVVSLVPLPGFGKSDYWNRDDLKSDIAAKWSAIALRIKRYTKLAGYDLINEPVPPDPLSSRTKAAMWADFAQELADEVRKVDRLTPLIVESAPWGFPSGFAHMQLVKAERVVYSFHFYAPREFTHQGLYELPLGVEYPSVLWSKSRLSGLLEPVRAFQRNTGAPVYVGEFSAVRWAPKNQSAVYLNDVIDLFEHEGWAWTYLGWRGYHGWDAELDSTVENDRRQGRLPTRRREDAPGISVLRRGFGKNADAKNGGL